MVDEDQGGAQVVRIICERPERCSCACPAGKCDHIWDGPVHNEDQGTYGGFESATCSKCGMLAVEHDLKALP